MPGAEFGPSKKWPAAHYAELALRVVAQGCQVWVLGSPRDQPEADEIDALTRGAVRNICGRTQLVDAVDLIAQAHIAVSNDSGLMHVAAAVGCPVVALYGSTSPTYAPPLTDRGEILYLGLDCSPCGARECPLLHHRCLKDLTPDRVHAVVLQHLAKYRREG
jgi:heptosyltransferase II